MNWKGMGSFGSSTKIRSSGSCAGLRRPPRPDPAMWQRRQTSVGWARLPRVQPTCSGPDLNAVLFLKKINNHKDSKLGFFFFFFLLLFFVQESKTWHTVPEVGILVCNLFFYMEAISPSYNSAHSCFLVRAVPAKLLQWCLTLCDPMGQQALLSMGFPRQ